MDSPFPGMNPYLENPTTWPNLHSRLIVAIANLLAPQIRPKYRVVVEEAVYKRDQQEQAVFIGVPDASIRSSGAAAVQASALPEGNIAVAGPIQVTLPLPTTLRQRYLEIRSLQVSDVIAVIEVLSPVNKRGAGRQKYENKRLEILESATHLIEIDLLHMGVPLPVGQKIDSHYRILVSDSRDRPQAQLYPFNLQQAFPRFEIPLANEDGPIQVNLKPLIDEIYDLSGYDLDIDYRQDPSLDWPPSERQWMDQQLKAQGLR
ncbi:MAG: DUF4058 family protein [Thermosynechococcaceae cyanobacterium]